MVFCVLCNSYQGASLEHHFSLLGDFFTIQLKRFLNDSDTLVNDIQSVAHVHVFSIPIMDTSITAHKKFRLVGNTGCFRKMHSETFMLKYS